MIVAKRTRLRDGVSFEREWQNGGGTGGKESINGRGGHQHGAVDGRTCESGTADPRFERTWGSEMADIPGRNSVCKVMHGHESGLNARRRTPPPWCWFVHLCTCVAAAAGYLRAISRISQYITGARARGCGPGFYLALLLLPLLPLRRYAGRCRCDTAGRGLARARKTQRPNPQRIVHAVLIGIHCRDSDLCRGLPTECRPDLSRYLGVPAPARSSILVPHLVAFAGFLIVQDCRIFVLEFQILSSFAWTEMNIITVIYNDN